MKIISPTASFFCFFIQTSEKTLEFNWVEGEYDTAHIKFGVGKKITPEFATEMHGLYDKQWAIELKAVKRCRAVVSGKISAATFFRVAKKLH